MAAQMKQDYPSIFLAPFGDVSSLVEAIGEKGFPNQLMGFLNALCQAEHCSIFLLEPDNPSQVASISLDGTDVAYRQTLVYIKRACWKRDPTFMEAQRRAGEQTPTVLRLDISTLGDRELRDRIYGQAHIRDRLFLCGTLHNGIGLGLSILRSNRCGMFSSLEVAAVRTHARALLALIAKHVEYCDQRSSFAMALTSLKEIEECIAGTTEQFPRREAQVCARMLYGLTSAGIALDLGIGEETVMTYRKRAYQRLKIGSYRELLLWYLEAWSRSAQRASCHVSRHLQRCVNDDRLVSS